MQTVPQRSGVRMSADERRDTVLIAAVREFAKSGYAGTSTEQIARRAGISQPYVFRLFGTKKALFLAAIEVGFARIKENFATAAEGLQGHAALEAMGDSYLEYLKDTDLLLLQLHAYAAASDDEIRAAVASHYLELVDFVVERAGISEVEVGSFFSVGMLLNVAAALQLERFQVLCGELAKLGRF